ncbi:MAG: ComEC/Rec2 family competence protein [Deltaproteobacteria bacterium]|nr:ComEC/Rec2 family competence protein [Deltaproteobacteria bacterium]
MEEPAAQCPPNPLLALSGTFRGLQIVSIGFFLGTLAGWASDALVMQGYYLAGLSFALWGLSHCFYKRFSLFFLACTGVFWAWAHSAVSPPYPVENVEITRSNVLPSRTNLIVRHGERFYRVKGVGTESTHGDVRVVPFQQIFGSVSASFTPYEPGHSSGLAKLSQYVGNFLDKCLVRSSPKLQALVAAIILGQKDGLDSSLTKDFRHLGIFHLLVVSGLHISFLSWLFLVCILAPFQCLYAFCLLSPRRWYFLQSLLRLISVAVVFIYGLGIGFPPAAQRAILLFSCAQGAKVFSLPIDFRGKVLFTLVAQQFFFPLDVVSVASLLSWTAYVTVVSLAAGGEGLRRSLEVQACLTLLAGGVLGSLSFAGFFLNLLIVPLFPLVVFGAVLQMVPSDIVQTASGRLLSAFIILVETCSEWFGNVSWSYLDLSHSPLARWSVLGAGFLFFLNIFKRLPIPFQGECRVEEIYEESKPS